MILRVAILSFAILSLVMLSVVYAQCHIFVMLRPVILSVVIQFCDVKYSNGERRVCLVSHFC
jgi:hypothetical protein